MQMGRVSSLQPLLRGPPPFLGFVTKYGTAGVQVCFYLFFLNVYFIFIYVYTCVHMCAGTYGGRKRVSDSLEEEL